jgi:hypothetical protein
MAAAAACTVWKTTVFTKAHASPFRSYYPRRGPQNFLPLHRARGYHQLAIPSPSRVTHIYLYIIYYCVLAVIILHARRRVYTPVFSHPFYERFLPIVVGRHTENEQPFPFLSFLPDMPYT